MLGIAWSEHRLTLRRLLMSVNTALMISNEGSAQSILMPMSLTLVVHLGLQISPQIFEKIEMVLVRLSGAR
jgi:hypothetical protein